MYSLYKITNKINNKVYIGITKRTLSQRFNTHVYDAKNYTHKLANSIKKYGRDNFKIELLEEIESKEDAYQKEIEFIKKFNTIEDGLNTHVGGLGGNTGNYDLVSIKLRGKNNPMFGKKHSEKTRRLLSEKGKAWRKTEDGKKRTELDRKFFSENNPGTSQSDETKLKISNAKKGKPCLKTRKYYEITHPDGYKEIVHGLKEFCDTHGLNEANMRNVYSGKYKKSKGYHVKQLASQSGI